MTDTLAATLRRLAGHLHHLQQELVDAPLHAPRYSQTDSRKTHSGPRPPCNLTNIDYLLDVGADDIIKGWATNLTQDTPAHGLPHSQPTATWCAWLYRNRHHLETVPWAQEATDELTELETTLRHHIHPQDPHQVKLPDYATAAEIAQALGKTPDAIRKWCTRHKVTAYMQQGKVMYRTTEIRG